MAPQTVQRKVLNKVAKHAAKDTLEKYKDDYNPWASYWVLNDHDKKCGFKHFKPNRWLKRDIYCPEGVDIKDAETLAHFRKWAWRFDMWFVSGTCGMTIGLGAILGLIPIVGDFADMIVGLLLIHYIKKRIEKSHKGEVLDEEKIESFQRVLTRMRIEVLFAAGPGLIPFFGPLFSTVYKANTRNVWILEQYMIDQARGTPTAMEMASASPAQPMPSHHPKGGR